MKETGLTSGSNRVGSNSATHLLSSPAFLVALLILAVNDHVLKEAYGNWVTGKLSDFAGLFAFALFLCAVWPKWRTMVCISTALAFIGWKSPVSDSIVAAWNALGMWPVQRVADPADLIALVSIALAWWYAAMPQPTLRLRSLRPISALCAIMLFAATSRKTYPHIDGTTFVVAQDSATVIKALELMRTSDTLRRRQIYLERGIRIYPNDWEFDVILSPRSANSAALIIVGVFAYDNDSREATLKSAHTWFNDSIVRRVNIIGDSLRRSENKSRQK